MVYPQSDPAFLFLTPQLSACVYPHVPQIWCDGCVPDLAASGLLQRLPCLTSIVYLAGRNPSSITCLLEVG